MKTGSISPANKLTYIRTLWASALVVSFLLSVLAAFRGGYVGPDYNMHLSRLLDSSKIFDFSATSPPTYYLLGHALLLVIGRNNAFPNHALDRASSYKCAGNVVVFPIYRAPF